MFIYKRIISLSIFLIFLLINGFLLFKAKNNNERKKILFLYSIVLAVLGFLYTPYVTADLYRIFEQLQLYYEPLNFTQFLNWAKTNPIFFGMLYYYFFAKIKVYSLLPAITAFIFYNLIFSIFNKSTRKFDIKSFDIIVIFIFIMAGGQYVDVISGIRCMLSMSIVAYCIYNEFFENKKIFSNIFLYIIASMIHPASLILVLLRFIYYIFQGKGNRISKFVKFILSTIFCICFILLLKNNLIEAFKKADGYATVNVYSYMWEYIIAIITMMYMFFVLRCFKRIDRVSFNNNLKFINFFKVIYIITLLCFPVYSIFHRYRSFLSMIFIPILCMTYRKLEKADNERYLKNFNTLSCVILIIQLLIVFVRGNLCGFNIFGILFLI